MNPSMIKIYHLSDELLVEKDIQKRTSIINKLNKVIKKNVKILLDNSTERIDKEILSHRVTEENYSYMIPQFMNIMSRYFSKVSVAS